MKRCERIMTRDPVTCRPNEPVVAAIERMLRADVGALPVVDSGKGRLAGIFTAKDAFLRVVARGLDPRTTPVRAAMTRDVATCLADDEIGVANLRMEELQVQRLPIVDDDGRLVGILTRDDLTTRVDGTILFADLLEEVHAED